jgi:hypothetical protein
VVLVYFTSNYFRIRAADPPYIKMYEDEVEALKERLTKRAKTKREAVLAEVESEDRARRIQESSVINL